MELMKAELESGAGVNADGVSSYQVKQLEQQNEKLKEALVKMRDMSNSDKAANASLKKQNEKYSQELVHLKKDKDTRVEEIEILNAEILDLKDQVSLYDNHLLLAVSACRLLSVRVACCQLDWQLSVCALYLSFTYLHGFFCKSICEIDYVQCKKAVYVLCFLIASHTILINFITN